MIKTFREFKKDSRLYESSYDEEEYDDEEEYNDDSEDLEPVEHSMEKHQMRANDEIVHPIGGTSSYFGLDFSSKDYIAIDIFYDDALLITDKIKILYELQDMEPGDLLTISEHGDDVQEEGNEFFCIKKSSYRPFGPEKYFTVTVNESDFNVVPSKTSVAPKFTKKASDITVSGEIRDVFDKLIDNLGSISNSDLASNIRQCLSKLANDNFVKNI